MVICLIIFVNIITGKENMALVVGGLIIVTVVMLIALAQYAVVFVKMNKEKNSKSVG